MKLCLHCKNIFDRLNYTCPHCGYHPETIAGFPVFAPELSITNDGFDIDLFKTLFNIEASHFWFRSRNKILQQCLKKYFPSAENFCEIGCGTGCVLAAIATASPQLALTGSEIYVNALGYAAKRVPHAELIQSDICNFPYISEFDVIGVFDVIEHIENDTLAIKNIYQALKKNGGLLLTVPQHKWLWSSYDEMACHKRRYSRKELNEKIQNAGFKIIRMTSFMTFLLPVMMAARFRKQKLAEPTTTLSISKPMNLIFYRINMIEQFLISRNINFPFGGSLLCIATK